MNINIKLFKNFDLLFIEDDKNICETNMETLSFLFKKVFIAHNGLEAIEIYKNETPDLILSDIVMSEMDGIKFASIIRENDQITPIIFLTSHTKQNFLMDAISLSINGYLIKPVNLHNMIAEFSKVLENSIYMRKKFYFSVNTYYDLVHKELYIDGKKESISNKEISILKLMLTKVEKVFNYEELNFYLYPLEGKLNANVIRIMTRLQKLLPRYIKFDEEKNGWKLELV